MSSGNPTPFIPPLEFDTPPSAPKEVPISHQNGANHQDWPHTPNVLHNLPFHPSPYSATPFLPPHLMPSTFASGTAALPPLMGPPPHEWRGAAQHPGHQSTASWPGGLPSTAYTNFTQPLPTRPVFPDVSPGQGWIPPLPASAYNTPGQPVYGINVHEEAQSPLPFGPGGPRPAMGRGLMAGLGGPQGMEGIPPIGGPGQPTMGRGLMAAFGGPPVGGQGPPPMGRPAMPGTGIPQIPGLPPPTMGRGLMALGGPPVGGPHGLDGGLMSLGGPPVGGPHGLDEGMQNGLRPSTRTMGSAECPIRPFAAGPHYGPVLDTMTLHIVKANLLINPLLRPPPDHDNHPVLEWNMTFPSRACRRSNDPPTVSWMIGRDEPATFPRVSELRIFIRTLPWELKIQARKEGVGVTCADVIEGLDDYLHRTIGNREFSAQPQPRQREISQAYYSNRSTAEGAPGGALGPGLLRLDGLCERPMFGGLVRNDAYARQTYGAAVRNLFELKCVARHMRPEDEGLAGRMRDLGLDNGRGGTPRHGSDGSPNARNSPSSPGFEPPAGTPNMPMREAKGPAMQGEDARRVHVHFLEREHPRHAEALKRERRGSMIEGSATAGWPRVETQPTRFPHVGGARDDTFVTADMPPAILV